MFVVHIDLQTHKKLKLYSFDFGQYKTKDLKKDTTSALAKNPICYAKLQFYLSCILIEDH